MPDAPGVAGDVAVRRPGPRSRVPGSRAARSRAARPRAAGSRGNGPGEVRVRPSARRSARAWRRAVRSGRRTGRHVPVGVGHAGQAAVSGARGAGYARRTGPCARLPARRPTRRPARRRAANRRPALDGVAAAPHFRGTVPPRPSRAVSSRAGSVRGGTTVVRARTSPAVVTTRTPRATAAPRTWAPAGARVSTRGARAALPTIRHAYRSGTHAPYRVAPCPLLWRRRRARRTPVAPCRQAARPAAVPLRHREPRYGSPLAPTAFPERIPVRIRSITPGSIRPVGHSDARWCRKNVPSRSRGRSVLPCNTRELRDMFNASAREAFSAVPAGNGRPTAPRPSGPSRPPRRRPRTRCRRGSR